MLENAANEQRRFFRRYVQKHQAIGRMAQRAFEKVFIAGEKRRLLEPVHQRQNVVVPDAQLGDVLANNSAKNPSRPEQIALIQRNVLVQEVHAAAERETKPPLSSNSALRARCTASVMAALLILPPPHLCTMKSQDK